jgi:hypothetical protein
MHFIRFLQELEVTGCTEFAHVMEITNNFIPTVLPFSLLTLSQLTQITMGCFLNIADSLN